MDSQDLIRTSQVIGIAVPLVSSGIFFASSFLAIHPLFPLSVPEATRIFADIFHTGSKIQAPLVSTGILFNAAAAYFIPEARKEHGAASLLVASTAALTAIGMLPGINKLVQASEQGDRVKMGRDTMLALLKSWKTQNYMRAGLALTAGALGLFAVAKRTSQSSTGHGRL